MVPILFWQIKVEIKVRKKGTICSVELYSFTFLLIISQPLRFMLCPFGGIPVRLGTTGKTVEVKGKNLSEPQLLKIYNL